MPLIQDSRIEVQDLIYENSEVSRVGFELSLVLGTTLQTNSYSSGNAGDQDTGE